MGEGHFADRLVVPCAQVVREYNNMMELVEQRVYEGNSYYKPVPGHEFSAVMRAWITAMMLRNTTLEQDKILAIGDKTPAHSFHIPLLRSLFPQARFIHVLRDGRDATVSAYHHRRRIMESIGQADKIQPLATEAPSLFSKWAGFVRAVVDNEAKDAALQSVRYEDLLSQPEVHLSACLSFLLPDTDFSEDSIRNAIQANRFETRSGGRAAGTVSDTSFLRRGLAGAWKEELDDETISRFNQDDLLLLSKLGYG
jgi:hypothetical protein